MNSKLATFLASTYTWHWVWISEPMFPLLTLKMVVRLVSAQHGRLRQGQLVEFLFLNHMSGHDALTKITISCYSHFKSWIKKNIQVCWSHIINIVLYSLNVAIISKILSLNIAIISKILSLNIAIISKMLTCPPIDVFPTCQLPSPNLFLDLIFLSSWKFCWWWNRPVILKPDFNKLKVFYFLFYLLSLYEAQCYSIIIKQPTVKCHGFKTVMDSRKLW